MISKKKVIKKSAKKKMTGMCKTKNKPIDCEEAKNGRLIRVWNTKRPKFSNAKEKYTAVWVEDKNGKNERCWLLTAKEIERIEHRSKRNKEDWTDKSFWTDLFD